MRLPFRRRLEPDVRAEARARLAAEERTRTFVPARPPALPTGDPLGMRTPTRARRPRPSYPIVAVTSHELPAFVQDRLPGARQDEIPVARRAAESAHALRQVPYMSRPRPAATLLRLVPTTLRAPSDQPRPPLTLVQGRYDRQPQPARRAGLKRILGGSET